MDRQRTFLVLLFLAAVTVFSACGVSGDEPGDDTGGGPSRMDGGSNSGAPHTPGTACSYDQSTYWSCTATVDPCAPVQQFCQANHTWSGCMPGPATADCHRDSGPVADAGPSDGGASSDADTDGGSSDADVEMDGGCMCPPSGHPCTDECGNGGTWWCPPDNPCELECWIEATADHMPCDAGVSDDDGGTTTPDADVPPVLDGDACVCPSPEICTTSCGIEGFRLCDRSAGCGLSRCLILPDSVCPDGGVPPDSGSTDSGPMDAGPTDSGTCACPAPDFCPVACGWGELVCNPTDCTTSCVPIPGTCLDSGPADAGPADTGPRDAGPCACTRFGDPCVAACGALGVITCTAAPECREQCSPVPGAACADAGPTDSGPVDSGPVDSGPADAGPADAGPMDAGPTDSGPVDSGPVDSGPADAGPTDSGPMSDAGPLATCSPGFLTIQIDTAQNWCPSGGAPDIRGFDSLGAPYSSGMTNTVVVPESRFSTGDIINNTVWCQTDPALLSWEGYISPLVGTATLNGAISTTHFRVYCQGTRDVRAGVFYCWDTSHPHLPQFRRVQHRQLAPTDPLPTGCYGTTGLP